MAPAASRDFNLAAARDQLIAGFPLVNNHPDVAGVLRNPTLLGLIGPALAYPFREAGVTAVVAPEARGPICGALVAVHLGVGLVLARKVDRNHPGADLTSVSQPTWRGHPEEFQARSFDLSPNDHVLIVDDWITTGNSIRAVQELVERCGASVLGVGVLVNKASTGTLSELRAHTLVDFDQLSES